MKMLHKKAEYQFQEVKMPVGRVKWRRTFCHLKGWLELRKKTKKLTGSCEEDIKNEIL